MTIAAGSYENATELEADFPDESSARPLPLAGLVVLGAGLYLLSLFTAVGNAMVLHAIRTERRLQTVSNMFILSLAVADLAVGLLVMPVSSAYVLLDKWPLGSTACKAWLALDYTASTASILNLILLSLDRYWAITSPLRYLRRRTRRRALGLIAGVWMFSAAWIVPIVAWAWIHNIDTTDINSVQCDTDFAHNAPFKVAAATLNFYAPSALMVYLYARIFATIRQRTKLELGQRRAGSTEERMPTPAPALNNNSSNSSSSGVGSGVGSGTRNENSTVPNPRACYKQLTVVAPPSGLCRYDGVTVVVEYVGDPVDPDADPLLGKARHAHHRQCYRGNSTGSSVERRPTTTTRAGESSGLRKEKKAARQLGVIVGAFLLCWIPYFSIFPVLAFCQECIPNSLHTVCIWLGYINSAMNPLLYPLCNANFKRAFKRMLGLNRKAPTANSLSPRDQW